MSELRQALAREIEYRRHLEFEVAQLKETVGALVVAQQQHAALADDQPDTTITLATPRRSRRSESKSRPAQPAPPTPTQPVSLTPVLPVSAKVIELEEKFNEHQQQSGTVECI